ncbi:MAG: hypothetical protein U0359_36585 [Byssovorax sp.]
MLFIILTVLLVLAPAGAGLGYRRYGDLGGSSAGTIFLVVLVVQIAGVARRGAPRPRSRPHAPHPIHRRAALIAEHRDGAEVADEPASRVSSVGSGLSRRPSGGHDAGRSEVRRGRVCAEAPVGGAEREG